MCTAPAGITTSHRIWSSGTFTVTLSVQLESPTGIGSFKALRSSVP
jgi:hypothetical protein